MQILLNLLSIFGLSAVTVTNAANGQTTTVSRIHLSDPLPNRPRAFINELGQEVVFHGSNAIVKAPPWTPRTDKWTPNTSMSKKDFEWMQRLGLNFLRLGVMWPGLETERGKYNDTYLDEVDKVVTLAGQHGVYVLLDAHQDGFSEYFCGEGVPSWAVKQIPEDEESESSKSSSESESSDALNNLNYDSFSNFFSSLWHKFRKLVKSNLNWFPFPFHRHRFPAPFDKPFDKLKDFYHEPLHANSKFPKNEACYNRRDGGGWGEPTYGEAYAFQGLYDNWNGTADSFALFWARVARRFKGRPEVVGLNLLNEPFAGDFYADPLIMIPYPYPYNADRVNLQPLYKKINDKIRSTDIKEGGGDNQDVLLFIAGVTWGDFGSGFSNPIFDNDGLYNNRTVLTYHSYNPPQFMGADEQVYTHIKEAIRLNTGAMMTESNRLRAKHAKNDIGKACDHYIQGWADWEWKGFFSGNVTISHSQYMEFGAHKTGLGQSWGTEEKQVTVVDGKSEKSEKISKISKDSKFKESEIEIIPPSYFYDRLARTYAPKVAGNHIQMKFNETNGDFLLEYEYHLAVNDVNGNIPTEIYALARRYPNGYHVKTKVLSGTGDVKVEIEKSSDSEWSYVRIYPGTNDLSDKARIQVEINGKKISTTVTKDSESSDFMESEIREIHV